MKIVEKNGDVFTAGEDFYLAHCISQDCKLGAGIAVQFNKRFELKYKLSRITVANPDCVLVGRIFNLVTKEKYWLKPTYETLKQSLEKMKTICLEKGIKKVAMPKIGSGLDKLNWNKVEQQIADLFKDTDLEIHLYEYELEDGAV